MEKGNCAFQMERGSRAGEADEEGRREGRGQPLNVREKWQITIVIKMAIWMIKGSLGLLQRRRGWRGHALNERQKNGDESSRLARSE